MDHKNLGFKYDTKIEDVPLSDFLRQASIKYENQLMVFYDFIWQDCLDEGRSIGSYIVCFQGGTIDHFIHVPGPVSQYSAESEYN